MKPAKFDYEVFQRSKDAIARLAESGDGSKPIAGAQSLGPLLNLRLVRPSNLVDISMANKLRETHEWATSVEIGAATTHAEIEDGETIDPTDGWLRDAAANIAHRAVRNRGTLGGSLAHADPAADWVIVMTGLGAVVMIDGPNGSREVAMDAFVTGPFETALGSAELIRSVRVPRFSLEARWGYWKFVRQVGEFAKASATVLVEPEGKISRVAVGALGRQPLVFDAKMTDELLEQRIAPAAALATALPDKSPSDLAMHSAALSKALAMVLAQTSHQEGGD